MLVETRKKHKLKRTSCTNLFSTNCTCFPSFPTKINPKFVDLLVQVAIKLCQNRALGKERRSASPGQHFSMLYSRRRLDEEYAKMTFPSREYRFLALFRFWNAIQYFYPYRDLLDEPWDSTLVRFIPKLVFFVKL